MERFGKRLLRLFLILTLIMIMPFTSHAQKKVASNLTWEKPFGEVSFDVNNDTGLAVIGFCKDGKCIVSSEKDISKIKGKATDNFAAYIRDSGDYSFYVRICETDKRNDRTNGIQVTSSIYSYKRPTTQLKAPKNLRWSSSKAGYAEWDPVPNAAGYKISLYNDKNQFVSGVYFYSNKTFTDFSSKMGDSDNTKYYFKVYALSSDIEKVAHSKDSKKSKFYDISDLDIGLIDISERTAKMQQAQSADSAKEILDDFINNSDKNALAIEMQTKSQVRDEVKSMEDSYKSKANVSLETTVTPDTGLDPEKVSVLGGCLNADPDDKVSFNVSLAGKEDQKAINTEIYKSVVQFDMDMTGASKVKPNGELAVPVVITMPVPNGVEIENLKILHYHKSDDGFDILTPRKNSDETISFTITHFSTFVFATDAKKTNNKLVGKTFKDKSGSMYRVLSKTEVAFVKGNKNAKTISIPSTVTYNKRTYKVTKIEKQACKSFKKLQTVTIGANVRTIGDYAFANCPKLEVLMIGSNVTTVGEKAIYGCSSLNTVTFPEKTNKFGKQFAGNCKKLKTLIVKSTKITGKTISNGACKGIGKNVIIKVPEKKLNSYRKIFYKKGLNKKCKVLAIKLIR